MIGSLIVVAFFVLGVLAGRSGGMPAWMLSSGTSFVALCALLLCVGISIGLNPDMKSEIKSLNPRLALLPVAILLALEHLHHRVSRRRTRHHRSAG